MEWRVSITDQQPFRNLVYYAGKQFEKNVSKGLDEYFNIRSYDSLRGLEDHLGLLTLLDAPERLSMEGDERGRVSDVLKRLRRSSLTCGLVIVILSARHGARYRILAKELRVEDYYEYPFDIDHISERLQFLRKFKLIRSDVNRLKQLPPKPYKIPVIYRKSVVKG